MLKSLIKAREVLGRKGIRNQAMCMILYAMAEEDWSYDRAVKEWAAYAQCSCAAVERELEEACRSQGIWTGARYVLESCFREVIR